MGLVAGAALYGHYWLKTSPRFATDGVTVAGNHQLSSETVAQQTGIAPGENVFDVDIGAVKRRLESDSWIGSASVRRELPNRIIVTVEERAAAALIELNGLYLVDTRGEVFKQAAHGEGAGLPVITGISRAEFHKSPDEARSRITAALEAAALYAASDRPRLGEVHSDLRRGFTLTTFEDAVSLRLGAGSKAELRERLSRFDAAWAALAEEEKNSVSVIHVDRSPQRVIVAFAGAR